MFNYKIWMLEQCDIFIFTFHTPLFNFGIFFEQTRLCTVKEKKGWLNLKMTSNNVIQICLWR